ncbi:MAG: HD domain-containing protein, partial [Coriobacteriia bacterium]|nr:HD domain-containing protein [Coriobacteriia bacterium]
MTRRHGIVVGVLLFADAILVAMFASTTDATILSQVFVVTVAYSLLNLLPLRLPRGDVLQVGSGVAVASFLLLSPSSAMIGAAAGAALSVAASKSMQRPMGPVLIDVARLPILVVAFAHVALQLGFPERLESIHAITVVVAISLTALYVLLDIASYAALRALAGSQPVLASVTSLVRLVGPMHAGQGSVGIVLAVLYPSMGLVGVVVLVALMAIMKHAFALLLRIRTAYTKTVGVLARLAEIEHSETRGHAERVADVASSVGRIVGLSYSQLQRLDLAALLHDLGRVRAKEGESSVIHAQAGAIIVADIPFLSDLAPVIEAHHADPRDCGLRGDELLMSQIIRTASDFDDM